MKTAKELGFVPDYIQMTKEQTKNFISVLFTQEKDLKEPGEEDMPFVLKILDKRIEVMKLLINFSKKAKLLALILSNNNPGKIVTILIDCLIEYEQKEVNENDICNLYPTGFYSQESFMDYVDNYLKLRKCKWSEIY